MIAHVKIPLMGKLWKVSSLVATLPSAQQLKFNLLFFFDLMLSAFGAAAEMIGTPTERLRDFLSELRAPQFQFSRGHGVNFLGCRCAANGQQCDGN
jgi:hypothetical protein